ncbi:MAG: ASKHA domain-containing protein [Candidatus Caldatribacteriaceae bacterium]
MALVSVAPFGRTLQAEKGESLLFVLTREGILLESYCGGRGSCGKCVVRVLEGEVSPPTAEESKHLRGRIVEGFRLACQVVLLGDVVCDVSFSLSGGPAVVFAAQSEPEKVSLEDSPVKRRVLEVKKPRLHSLTSLKEEVEKEIHCSFWEREALSGLALLGEEDSALLEVFQDEESVFCVHTPPGEAFLGVAFDLGTTTVACELVDLSSGKTLLREGTLNRQTRFGADVISRLRAIQDDPQNLERLQKDAVETMNDLIKALCRRTGHDPLQILSLVVAGNTIMEHLFLGLSPLSIGVSPYVPVTREAFSLRAKDLGLCVSPSAPVYVFPVVAGYVGGDIVAGAGAFDVHKRGKVTLYVDIGTNGEIVLCKGEEMFACGTAAGPAFEGAGVRFGMLAKEGAINAVYFEDRSLRYTTIGGVPPRGICGTGLLDVLAGLVALGLLTPAGRLQKRTEWSSFFGREDDEEAFIVSWDPFIPVTQRDIEKLQLALAAMKAGRDILLYEAGLREEAVEEVILAGAFGSYIRPESARALGLIPPSGVTYSVGNASLLGARKALLSLKFRQKVEYLARRVHYIELSARRDFEDRFVEALIFH